MKEFQREWDADFNFQSAVDQPNQQSMMSSSTPSSCCKVVHSSRIVIDDILLYSTNVFTLLRYFSCVVRVFVRYMLYFKLSKCKFFSPRVGYLGCDLTSGENCPAKSKFDLFTDWTLPNHGIPLSSFIGLCAFYSCFSPWFEINLKPLHLPQWTHHRKEISSNEWTLDLIRLFNKCKKGTTSSLVLARYDSDKSNFLMMDWSVERIGSIGADNIPDFGQRVLFHPLRKPNLSKFRLWTDTVPLTYSNCYLQGPFILDLVMMS